jgi:hypothetical protein
MTNVPPGSGVAADPASTPPQHGSFPATGPRHRAGQPGPAPSAYQGEGSWGGAASSLPGYAARPGTSANVLAGNGEADPRQRWPVIVAFPGQAPQRRATIGFRLVLAIPHAVVLSFIGIAAGVIAFLGWFGALFTGHLPVFAARFLTGYLRWLTCYYSYLLLLTDVYPRFTLDDYDYPVRVYARPGRLNRAAVLFRIVLLVPAWIVAALAGYGVSLLSVVSWVIALVAGRLPAPLYGSEAAVIRHAARYWAYAMMLTSAYPKGIYGDKRARGSDPGPPWRLTLTRGAKRMVTVFLLLGAAGVLVPVTLSLTLGGGANQVDANLQASLAHSSLNLGLAAENSASANCQTLSCATVIEQKVARLYQTFSTTMQGIAMPSEVSAQASAVISAAEHARQVYASIGAATTSAQYNQEVGSLAPLEATSQVSTSFQSLQAALASLPGSAAGNAAATLVQVTRDAAADQVLSAGDTIDNSLQIYSSATQGCDVNGQYSLPCLMAADRALAQAYRQYEADIERVPFPADAFAQARGVVTTSSNTAQLLAEMGASTARLQWYHEALGLPTRLNSSHSSYVNLVQALGG